MSLFYQLFKLSMENNAAISPDTKMADSPKESSWTFYIQGFMFGNDGETTASLSSEFESPSLVSDADSSPTKKPTMTLNDHCNPVLSSPKHTGIVRTMDRLGSFKKRKTESMNAVDYDFEDTASSPANSPKVVPWFPSHVFVAFYFT